MGRVKQKRVLEHAQNVRIYIYIYIVRLSLLTMTSPNQLCDVVLFVCSKMADETNLSSKLPVADRTREVWGRKLCWWCLSSGFPLCTFLLGFADYFCFVFTSSPSYEASPNYLQLMCQTSHHYYFRRNVRKCTFPHMLLTNTQISLHMAHSYQSFTWRNSESLTIQNVASDDFDQTAQMRRLIWIFAGQTCPKVRFLPLRFIQHCENKHKIT